MSTDGFRDSNATTSGELVAGRYRLESLLARGGAGAVWKVLDISDNKPLALKQLLPEARKDKRLALLFQREYHTLARLDHPRVIEVYDYGVTPAGPYYTMELLDGMDLGELSPIPFDQACGHLRDVASSLALLHSRRLLHRDLSPRNVRCTSDGRCKLLDFGTMATFGVASEIVGTPPLVPPEALRGMPLDNRADIYALGALAYRVLTRRHAYRARQLEDLPELFRHAPPPPSALVASIPAELDALVLSMLQLDPLLRPSHVSEIIERLTAIGNLPETEDAVETTRSYLVATRLVGRKRVMEPVKAHLKSAVSGRGASVMIEANPGVGKSRLLDEASLHAQLLGALVLRVEARSHHGPSGVMMALARALKHAAPRDADQTSQPLGRVLSVFIEQADGLHPNTETPRAQVQQAMCSWLTAFSSRRPLIIIVDDLQWVDEPSAAFLTTLSRTLERLPILLLTSRRLSGRAGAPHMVNLLTDEARRIRLHRLKPKATTTLVKSLFGDVQNVEAVAQYIHQVTTGSPQQIMDLCEHLVDRSIVRFAEGMWVLPTEVASAGLPSSLSETIQARLSALPRATHALAAAASVKRGPLPLNLLVALSVDMTQEEVFAHVDALVRGGIMVGSTDGYLFGQDALRKTLRDSMDPSLRKRCHGQVGAALLSEEAPTLTNRIEAGYHTLRSGNELAGAQLLVAAASALGERGDELDAATSALEAALKVLQRERAAPIDILRLQTTLIMSADREMCERHGGETLHQLGRYAGLPTMAKTRNLIGAVATLSVGLGSAMTSRLLTATDQRGPKPTIALTLLFRALFVLLPVRSSDVSVSGVRALADIAKTISGAPTIGPIADAMMSGVLAVVQGRYGAAEVLLSRTIELLRDEATTTMLPTESHRGMLAGAYIALGLMRAEISPHSSQTLDLIDALEELGDNPKFSGLSQGIGPDGGLTTAEMLRAAHQIRLAYHMSRCETELAYIHSRKLSVAGLRAGLYWQFDIFRTIFDVRLAILTKDLGGLRRSNEHLKQFNKGGTRLERHSKLILSTIALILGRTDEALQLSSELVSDCVPGEHLTWDLVFLQRAETLKASGDLPGAAQNLHEAIAAFENLSSVNTVPCQVAKAELARVEAAMGQVREGQSRMNRLLEQATNADHPLLLTRLHYAAAEIEMLALDQIRAESHVRHTQHWAAITRNPALLTRAHRLEQRYRQAFGVSETVANIEQNSPVIQKRKVEAQIEALMAGCAGDAERARRALSLVLEATEGTAGHLFMVLGTEPGPNLKHSARIGVGEPQDQLERDIRARVIAALRAERAPTLGEENTDANALSIPANLEQGTPQHQVLLLWKETPSQRNVEAVIAIPDGETVLRTVQQNFLNAIADYLHGGNTTAIKA